ncbi:MAG: ATP-binding cassette domain-containing protein [Nitrospirota bacterium]
MIEKIEAHNIIKRFNSRFLLQYSLNVRRGALYAIVGPNGSGKSTLLNIISLNDRPDSGSIHYFNGSSSLPDPFNNISLRRKAALVPTRAALFNETVYDNTAYGLRLRKVEKKEIRERVMQALYSVGLSEKSNCGAHELSSGEAQRLILARALVLEPEALFFDEPTASLDPDNTKIIEDIIYARVKKSGKITVMVTHNLNQAKAFADFVIFMYKGKILEMSDAVSFFRGPSTEIAKKFVLGEIY